MLEYSTYAVISPEGCASILWKTAEKAPEAAEAMGITAERLKGLGIVDKVIAEPLGGAHRDPGRGCRIDPSDPGRSARGSVQARYRRAARPSIRASDELRHRLMPFYPASRPIAPMAVMLAGPLH